MPDSFHGLFEILPNSRTLVTRQASPRAIPDPHTGRMLKVATVELSDRGVCPSCTQLGSGGYISFVSDLRLAFACPGCRKLIWINGA